MNSIGSKAFSGCITLKSINLGKSLTSIGSEIFEYCYNLESIAISNENTFYDSRENCNAIIESATNTLILGVQSTKIPDGVTTIGERAFYNCRGLSFVEFPNSITLIKKYAFAYCDGLTSVNIPNSVASIEECAFYRCSRITSVYLGNGLKRIDLSSVLSCDNLADLYCYTTTPPSMVYGTNYSAKIGTVTLHVPAESISAYSRFPWDLFRNIVAIK